MDQQAGSGYRYGNLTLDLSLHAMQDLLVRSLTNQLLYHEQLSKFCKNRSVKRIVRRANLLNIIKTSLEKNYPVYSLPNCRNSAEFQIVLSPTINYLLIVIRSKLYITLW